MHGSAHVEVLRESGGGSLNCASDPPVYVAGGGSTFAQVQPHLTTSKYSYGTLRYQLENLLNGGHSDQVVTEMIGTWSQPILDLRDSLMALSPYLSQDVLRALVDLDVPVAVKAEVLIANPDATKQNGFLAWAETEAVYPLPGYVADAIEASWDERTYRTILEEQVADAHTILTQTAWYALHVLQTDTAPAEPDTLRWVWQQVRTNGARYAEAGLLMGQGRYAEADSLIEAMAEERDLKQAEEVERQHMLAFIGVLRGAAEDDRDIQHLTGNEIQILQDLVDGHYDRASNWASNLLCAVYSLCRAPYTGGTGAPKSGGRRRDSTKPDVPAAKGYFGLQPNPTRGLVVFTYAREADATVTGTIVILDLAGRTMATLPMNGPQGTQTWDTRGIAPGTYLVQFSGGNAIMRTEKLIIQR